MCVCAIYVSEDPRHVTPGMSVSIIRAECGSTRREKHGKNRKIPLRQTISPTKCIYTMSG